MTTLPDDMLALVQKKDGFAKIESTGPYLDDLAPYLTATRQPLPEIGPGQVLIRLRLAAINPSDIHFIKGEYGIPRVKGAAAGFEGCGDVVATGPGAEALEGRRVAFIGSKTGTGAWAEYVRAEAASCVPLPDIIRDEDAAGLFVNPLTAIGMVSLAAEAGTGAIVMTAGGSQLSKLMIGLAKDRGIKTIPLVRRDAMLAPLAALGADHPLNVTAPDFAERFADVSKQEKPRILLDAVADDVTAQVFFGMPNRTRWVVYGKLNPMPVAMTEMGQFVFTGKRIEGFWLTQWLEEVDSDTRKQAFGTLFERFGSGAWRTDLQAVIPLAEAHARLPEELMRENTGKVMFAP
ncbi:MAG: alcohol dehydrogenase catalytic domain-containing protein [Pseudomonadota bacterium]